MPYYLFQWNQLIERHLAENDVTPEEFELVVCNPDEVTMSNSSDRLIAFGSVDGRYLACVYEMLDELNILPVTAFEVE
jgi:uncharacterized DUF497 family protein